jgi:hypothetical protein
MSEIEKRTQALDRLAVEIRTEVDAAEADFQSAVQHAIRAGELLIDAKAQVKHGGWLPWLEANFPLSERTARNYMRMAEKSATVADLPTIREAVALLTVPKPDPEPQVRSPRDALDEIPVFINQRDTRGKEAKKLSEAGDHLGAAKLLLDAIEAHNDAIRGWARLCLLAATEPVDDTHRVVLARCGAAGLRYVGLEPWDEGYVEAHAEWQDALHALDDLASPEKTVTR